MSSSNKQMTASLMKCDRAEIPLNREAVYHTDKQRRLPTLETQLKPQGQLATLSLQLLSFFLDVFSRTLISISSHRDLVLFNLHVNEREL